MDGATLQSTEKVKYISDRYRMEESLGHGGMASVFRVFDRAANKEVALKLLKKEASKRVLLASLFEREFYTLVHLAQPRIIEVYDFGVDTEGAYYTMELLDGDDLRKLAPLDWKEACKLLRDVASSLALLHSRRLLHRDVSSRNVRCTRDGRAKLIDFGAMAPMGAPAKVMGTAAFIAPEAINHQPLDQRTDLYSLGALAYWLITRRYAYRAHAIGELQDAWRTEPLQLAAINPDIPKRLNDLVMSLLSLDRMARPSFASEVVETLEACAGLEPEDTVALKQAYLTTPQLVGRATIVTELRKRMLTMLGGRSGETLSFEGPSGIGRSRLLAEVILEGKVIGARVLTAEAEIGAQGDYGVVWKLVKELFMSARDLAVETFTPYVGVLGSVFPGLSELMRSRNVLQTEVSIGPDTAWPEVAVDSGERTCDRCDPQAPAGVHSKNPAAGQNRAQIQKTLLDIFLHINQNHPLVIAVDNIHRADEPSVALLSALALKSQEHLFVIALTAENEGTGPADYAVLSRIARHIKVEPLDAEATEALLKSIFGETPNLGLVADHIYRISKGTPRVIMQLAQHLVDRGTVKYQAGAWALPASLDLSDLPSTLTEALKTKMCDLSAGAVALAQTIALSAEQRFSFEECLALTEHKAALGLTQHRQELIARDVLSTDGTFYGLSQQSWATVLTENADQETVKAGHLRLAALFAKRKAHFLAARHLFRAGQLERALDLWYEQAEKAIELFGTNHRAYSEYIQSLPKGWADTCQQAVELGERLGRSPKQILILRSLLSRSRFSAGAAIKAQLSKIVDQLYRDSGLADYRELNNVTDEPTRVFRALELAQQRYDATAESKRGLPPLEAIRKLAGEISLALDFSATTFDHELWASAPSVKPFVPLSPAIGLLEKLREMTVHIVVGRFEEAKRGSLEMLDILAQLDDAVLTGTLREYARLNLIYGIGLIEASIGISTALNRADEIEPNPLLQTNAWQIRLIYYLRQGNSLKAHQCQKQLELLQIQNSPRQFYQGVQLFPALLAYASQDDLSGVAQTFSDLEHMAERYTTWKPILYFAQGEHQRICGDYSGALQRFEEVFSLVAPARHAVWPYTAGARLKALLGLDRLEEAKTLGVEWLDVLERENYGYICSLVEMPLALVYARSEEYESAERLANHAIERLKRLDVTGAYLGAAYETRARVAIYADDPKSFRIYSKLCGEQYQIGLNPGLTAKHETLVQEARQAYLGVSQETRRALELTTSLAHDGDLFAAVQAQLVGCQSYQELLDGALKLMVDRSGATEGYLYLPRQGELSLVCQKGDQAPTEQAVETMRSAFIRFSDEVRDSESTATATDSTMWRSMDSEYRTVESVMLSVNVFGKTVPVGSVILNVAKAYHHPTDNLFYEAIARCLYDSSYQKW